MEYRFVHYFAWCSIAFILTWVGQSSVAVVYLLVCVCVYKTYCNQVPGVNKCWSVVCVASGRGRWFPILYWLGLSSSFEHRDFSQTEAESSGMANRCSMVCGLWGKCTLGSACDDLEFTECIHTEVSLGFLPGTCRHILRSLMVYLWAAKNSHPLWTSVQWFNVYEQVCSVYAIH